MQDSTIATAAATKLYIIGSYVFMPITYELTCTTVMRVPTLLRTCTFIYNNHCIIINKISPIKYIGIE